MTGRIINCPETHSIELVKVEETPLGTLVLQCSRFGSACAITCSRMCAAHFDRPDGDLELDLVVVVDVGDETDQDGTAAKNASLASEV